MNDESVKKLREVIQQKLDEIDKLAEGIPDTEDCWKGVQKSALEIRGAIEPYLAGFESQAFFIVTFGMLKAGKSTLVNTLVGKRDVSPVGHGRETTKRSSIIFSADSGHPEGIYIYKLKIGAPHDLDTPESIAAWRAKECEKLLLALGGVGNIEEEFSVDGPRPLSELGDLLTSKPDETEFPPVIRIEYDKDAPFAEDTLLKDGVAILDTPGLDGVDVNANTDCFWQVLPAQGDFFMLVQSSMSGLNDDCANQIAKIYGKTENSPGILIVYNEIAAEFWLKGEDQKDKLRKDRDVVASYLRGKIRDVSRGADPDIISVNAGAANAARFGNDQQFLDEYRERQKLYEESNFSELHNRLLTTLKNDRARIKVSRLRGLIGQELAKHEEEIKKSLESLNSPDNNKKIEAERKNRGLVKEYVSTLLRAFRENEGKIVGNITESVVSEASRTWSEEDIPDVPSLDGRSGKDKCKETIAKWVKRANDNFSKRIRNCVVSGSGILDLEPWTSFTLPGDVVEAYVKVGGYLDETWGDREFRLELLRGINRSEIEDALGFDLKDEDREFGGFLSLIGLGVFPKTFSGRVNKVMDKLKEHFGVGRKRSGNDAQAMAKLRNYIKETILREGCRLADDLNIRVEEKVKVDEERDKIWERNNARTIECLTRIRILVDEIHKEIRRN